VSVVGSAVVQPFQWVATLANLLFIIYVVDAFLQVLRQGDREQRRKAMIIYEISRDIVGSARTALEAQGLRNDLAHVARVNTMSQLSASLAHELNQPL